MMPLTPRKIFFLALFLAILFQAGGYAQRYYVKNYNVQHGLVQSQVISMVQDDQGYLWLGTLGGLSRFDGFEFTNYTRRDGLASLSIYCSLKDRQGRIWFGHDKGRITRYDPVSGVLETPPDFPPLPEFDLTCIFEDRRGQLWFGAQGAGAIRFDGRQLYHYTRAGGVTDSVVYDICQPAPNEIWLAGSLGIQVFDSSGVFVKRLNPELLKDATITSLRADSYGNVWIGTWEGKCLRAVVQASGEYVFEEIPYTGPEKAARNTILSIYIDHDRNVWLSTSASGAWRLSLDEQGKAVTDVLHLSEAQGLNVSNVNSVLQDREGNYWFATSGGGVGRFRDERLRLYGRSSGLTNEVVWAIHQDKQGQYWIGNEKGLTKLSPIPGLSHEYVARPAAGVQGEVVYAVKEDRQGKLWLAFPQSGLKLFDPLTGRLMEFPDREHLPAPSVHDVVADRQGNLWLASYSYGLVKCSPDGQVLKVYTTADGLSSNYIYTLFVDKDNVLWIGTDGGSVTRFDGRQFSTLGPAEGLAAYSIISFAQDDSGNIWMASPDNGLYRYDGQNFLRFSGEEGLSSDLIYGITVQDARHLLVCTGSGADLFDLSTMKVCQTDIFSGIEGLELNQNAIYRDSRGSLWFGSIMGALEYRPDEIRENKIPPQVYLRDVRLYLEKTPLARQARFSYKENYLSFDYTGINLTAPEEIRFRYMLEGFDEDWSPETPQRTATYSKLPPGKYTFKVRARNAAGLWSPETAAYSFEITPPLWATWWFRLLVVILTGGLGYLGLRSRLKKIERHQKELEIKVKERTCELEAQKAQVEQTLEALQVSEAKFRQYTENSRAAIFIQSDEKFRYLNPLAAEILGDSIENLLDQNIMQFIHPDSLELVQQQAERRLQGDQGYFRYEIKIISRQGRTRWMDFSTCTIDYQGELGILATAFDITERKIAEEALAEREAQLRTLINAMPDFVCFKDHQGRWLEANRFAVELFQLEGVEYHGRTDLELADYSRSLRELAARWQECDQQAWRDEQISRSEETITGPEGRPRIFEVTKVPIFFPDGSRQALVVIGRDITDHKKAEQALMAEKEKLDITLSSLVEGVITTDAEGRIVLMNPFARSITGCRQPPLGQALEDYVQMIDEEDGVSHPLPLSSRAADEPSVTQAESLFYFPRSGQKVKVAYSIASLCGDVRRCGGSVLVFEDITEKKKLENEAFRAQKLESIGMLAGGIAHDFNNILTAILGNIALSRMDVEENSKAFRWLGDAENAISRAKSLTQQLLTFSRGGAPVISDVSIAEMITQTVDFVLRGANVNCDYDLAEDLWGAKVDADQISQVLNNLVLNAQQAMPEGGRIKISARNLVVDRDQCIPLEPGNYVCICVADQGVGIPAKYLTKIFDPYFTTKHSGSGLGLATVYSIVQKHHGYISVESELNKGARFYLYLPAVSLAKPAAPAEESRPLIEKGSARLLLMDDDPSVRDTMGQLLTHLGYQVDFARDGGEALKKYRRAYRNGNPFDLVIMDLTIPGGMGGKEAVKHLIELDPQAKAVVSSGYSNDEVMSHYQDYGFKGIIKKPFRLDEISQVVKKLV